MTVEFVPGAEWELTWYPEPGEQFDPASFSGDVGTYTTISTDAGKARALIVDMTVPLDGSSVTARLRIEGRYNP